MWNSEIQFFWELLSGVSKKISDSIFRLKQSNFFWLVGFEDKRR
jgi:hypothetical protein